MKKLTKEQWVGKCQLVHGDKYDYTESEYVDARTKTKIKCKKHNIVFEMTPDNHRRGEGCPICRYEKAAEKNRQTVEEFIKKATEIHNGKYDYSRVKYVNNRTKVEIVCPEHGVFTQRPDKHILRGQGCPYCSGNAKRTTESFVKDAKKVHNDKYDYSKVIYSGIHNLVCIVCPIHGEFYQAPNDHLRGQGCPHCKQSKIEKIVFDTLTEDNITFETQYKYDDENQKNRLDFYLPKYNVAIECQGEQHFIKANKFNRKRTLDEIIAQDVLKNELCKTNNVKLIYYTSPLVDSLAKEKNTIYENVLFTSTDSVIQKIRDTR